MSTSIFEPYNPRDMLAAFVLAAVAGAQTAAGIPARDASISAGLAAVSGRVTVGESSLPLPRIVVVITSADRSRVLREITDDEGRYRFAALEAGPYVLYAAPGPHRSTYLPQRYGDTEPPTSVYEPTGPNLVLRAGEIRSGVDLALWRALAIEGRVLDSRGEPMANVQVAVNRPDGRIATTMEVSTDDLGAYRVYGLSPGRYRVCAEPRERSDVQHADDRRLVRTCHPTATIDSAASDVTLASTDALGIDIVVQRVGSYSISGTVIDGAGTPADDAFIGAYSLEESGVSAYSRTRNGEYVIKGLIPGRYVIKASAGGSPPGEPPTAGREMEVAYAWADVGAGDMSIVPLTLSKPTAVAGRVTFEGEPTPRPDRLKLVVQMRVPDDRMYRFESRPPFAAVGDDLRFTVRGLYRLPLAFALHGLPDGWALKAVRLDGRDITYVATDLGSASSRSQLEIVLTNRVARPSVRVLDAQGAPASSYHVISLPADPSRRRFGLRPVSGTPTSDGVLELGAMLPGEYLLAALPAHDFSTLVRDPARIEDLPAVSTRARLEEGDARTIELRLTNLPAR